MILTKIRAFTCREVIQERVCAEGRTAKWLKIIKIGNDDFREVYDAVWRRTILTAEKKGIGEYRQSVAKLQASMQHTKTKQSHKELLPLYREAARIKPFYDKTMHELEKRFKATTGATLDLKICPTLKKLSRIVEKSLLKSKVEGDVSGVKDIVRLVWHVCIISIWCFLCPICPIHLLVMCTQVNGHG